MSLHELLAIGAALVVLIAAACAIDWRWLPRTTVTTYPPPCLDRERQRLHGLIELHKVPHGADIVPFRRKA